MSKCEGSGICAPVEEGACLDSADGLPCTYVTYNQDTNTGKGRKLHRLKRWTGSCKGGSCEWKVSDEVLYAWAPVGDGGTPGGKDADDPSNRGGNTKDIIIASSVVGGAGALLGAYLCYRRRSEKKGQESAQREQQLRAGTRLVCPSCERLSDLLALLRQRRLKRGVMS